MSKPGFWRTVSFYNIKKTRIQAPYFKSVPLTMLLSRYCVFYKIWNKHNFVTRMFGNFYSNLDYCILNLQHRNVRFEITMYSTVAITDTITTGLQCIPVFERNVWVQVSSSLRLEGASRALKLWFHVALKLLMSFQGWYVLVGFFTNVANENLPSFRGFTGCVFVDYCFSCNTN